MIDVNKIVGDVSSRIKNHYKKIILQFRDGLKPYSKVIYKKLSEKYPDKIFFIWLGSNFGGCDVPILVKDLGFDCIVNFGHTRFIRSFRL